MLQGTLIRIWDTAKRVQLVELRRGADQARIYCINFSCSDEWLCCSSDKASVLTNVQSSVVNPWSKSEVCGCVKVRHKYP